MKDAGAGWYSHVRSHHAFKWDQRKATANRAKHRVSFEQAAAALADEFADRFHFTTFQCAGEEDRWLTFASSPYNRSVVLAVVWTEQRIDDQIFTRIISARYVTARERRGYEQEIENRYG